MKMQAFRGLLCAGLAMLLSGMAQAQTPAPTKAPGKMEGKMEGKMADKMSGKMEGKMADKMSDKMADKMGGKMADGPVAKQLMAVSAGVEKQAPAAAKVFSDGVMAVAETGITQKALKVGDKVPTFALPDANGRTVKLADLLAKGPVVLTWYRGGWCPYCNVGLKGLADAQPELAKLGASVIGVSPETPTAAMETAKSDRLAFPLLSDQGNAVARKFGIVYKLPSATSMTMKEFQVDLMKTNGDGSDELPLGVTYVIDTTGTIRWAFVDADYRKRAEPSDVVAAVKALKR